MEIRLALTGFGNVGRGVATLLSRHADEYERQYGVRLTLSAVADRGGSSVNPHGLDPDELLEAKQGKGSVAASKNGETGLAGRDMLDRSRAHVLLEASSTNFDDAEPGWGYVQAALDCDMDVVLASKGALVLHYRNLTDDVIRRERRLKFAGTVGAPLPVLELAEHMFSGVRIDGFEGVVNGTSNFVLMLMAEGAQYEEAVREAQVAGIAETDPTLDVDGWDASAKAMIIANSVFGANLRLQDVRREGIRSVTRDQFDEAAVRGGAIKLVSKVRRAGDVVTAEVLPEFRSHDDVLGGLAKDEMGMLYRTDLFGTVTATVQEVGGLPTAATVIRDVLNLASDRGWTAAPPR